MTKFSEHITGDELPLSLNQLLGLYALEGVDTEGKTALELLNEIGDPEIEDLLERAVSDPDNAKNKRMEAMIRDIRKLLSKM